MIDKNIILTIILVLGTFVTTSFIKYFFKKIGKIRDFKQKRIFYITKSVQMFVFLVFLFLLGLIWSVSLNSFLVFASSVFAIVGVALFAQWSILSNLTSSIIIFFSFPARAGDTIKILDGDNSIKGTIVEISLFQTEIIDEEGNAIFYPNNIFVQKPIMRECKYKNKKKTEPIQEDYQI